RNFQPEAMLANPGPVAARIPLLTDAATPAICPLQSERSGTSAGGTAFQPVEAHGLEGRATGVSTRRLEGLASLESPEPPAGRGNGFSDPTAWEVVPILVEK